MTKTISETVGKIGDKNSGKAEKKELAKSIKSALLSSVSLMKDSMSSSNPVSIKLCLDLKRKLEEVEKEFGLSLI
jgi:hypothetical protein